MVARIAKVGLVGVVLAFLLAFSPAFAQETGSPTQETAKPEQGPDYSAWDAVASRAEQALEADAASTATFEDLRKELVEWRSRLLAAQDVNKNRIESVREQIDALGPKPAEGEDEPAAIAERRKELNDNLALLQVPRTRAIEALNRANNLIEEIDRLIRRRDTAQLFKAGPIPVLPDNWAVAWGEIKGTVSSLRAETGAGSVTDSEKLVFRDNVLPLIALVIAGTFLVLNGPGLVRRLLRGLPDSGLPAQDRLTWTVSGVLGLVSVGGGLVALYQAAMVTGLVKPHVEVALRGVGVAVFAVIFARWLMPKLANVDAGLGKAAGRLGGTANAAGWLALSWALLWLVDQYVDLDLYSDETISVVRFPLVVAGGTILALLAGGVRRHAKRSEGDAGLREWAQKAFLWVALAAGIVAPLAALAGYSFAGSSLLSATVQTLALLGVLVALMAITRDLYGVILGRDDEALQNSLTPIFFNSVLTLATLPVLAVIWGVRWAELVDYWAGFREGIELGDTRITPGDFLAFVVVFVVGLIVTRALQSTLKNSVLPKTSLDTGGRNALVAGVGYVGIFLAAIIAISSAGIDLSSLAIVAGALSVGIGFGLQNIVSNFVSGIILLIERPIAEGDWIEVGTNMGYVRDISVRSTRIETFDRTDVIVPNADLISGTVTNFTRGNRIGRVIIPISVAYGTDTRKVEAILREIAEAHDIVAADPPPNIVFQSFGADGLEFEIRAILKDVNLIMSVKTDINHEIARRFGEEGIEIPFAQRDIWLRNPETLTDVMKGKPE